jgi:hypothetical protein
VKIRTTLILLGLVIAVGVWIKFFESKQPNTVESERQAGNVLNFDRDKLSGIVIKNGDDRVALQLTNGKWRLTAPVQDQADASAVDNLISDLETWRKVAVVSNREGNSAKGSLSQYGLAEPKLTLTLQMPQAPPTIRFGKEAAFTGEMYVQVGEGTPIVIAAQNVLTDISKKPDDFRDRKLTSLTTAQVDRAVVKSLAGEIELAKKNGHWEIEKPLHARGDDEKIGDFLAQLTNARIEEFVANDRGDLHDYGLAEPRGSITIYGADEKQGETIELGAVTKKKANELYVRSIPRHGIYALPLKTEEMLKIKPNDLRDRHLVRLDTNNLDRIHIAANGQPETVLARKGENWTIASLHNALANDEEVTRLVTTLSNQRVTRFVADTASDLAKYGLDHPQLQLTFSSFASENTAETTAGEHPFLSLSFGKIDGDNVYARVGEEPFIVAVNRQLLDEIWSDPLRWQALTIFQLKPGDIEHFSRVTTREESFERSGQTWKPIKGDSSINLANVQSLLNTLASLRAVRWAGAITPADGFEKPDLVITFATKADAKTLQKLTIGKPTPDGMSYAKLDNRDGAFVLNNPDVSALKLPLIKGSAAPNPSPLEVVSSPVPAPPLPRPSP